MLTRDAERIKREESRTAGAVRELADMIGLPMIKRIEAFDISNISGFENVGSMIVYEDGKPKKSAYRKFRIKSFSGADDYRSMREVLMSRFEHGIREQEELSEKNTGFELGSFSYFPDLIMMDGGRGQVNIALSVLEDLGLDIAVCGMVKDDRHNTRGLYYNNKELPIDTGSELFKLITRVQDEAHRFAIEYHRSLRSKGQVKSLLDDIEGIGPARRKALLRAFGSVENIAAADTDALRAVDGMNEKSAKSVYAFFRQGETDGKDD